MLKSKQFYAIKFPRKLPDTLWQMHDGHAAARDQIPDCILPDGVTGQPVQDWDPAQQSLLQSLSRTPVAQTLHISGLFGRDKHAVSAKERLSKKYVWMVSAANGLTAHRKQ